MRKCCINTSITEQGMVHVSRYLIEKEGERERKCYIYDDSVKGREERRWKEGRNEREQRHRIECKMTVILLTPSNNETTIHWPSLPCILETGRRDWLSLEIKVIVCRGKGLNVLCGYSWRDYIVVHFGSFIRIGLWRRLSFTRYLRLLGGLSRGICFHRRTYFFTSFSHLSSRRISGPSCSSRNSWALCGSRERVEEGLRSVTIFLCLFHRRTWDMRSLETVSRWMTLDPLSEDELRRWEERKGQRHEWGKDEED